MTHEDRLALAIRHHYHATEPRLSDDDLLTYWRALAQGYDILGSTEFNAMARAYPLQAHGHSGLAIERTRELTTILKKVEDQASAPPKATVEPVYYGEKAT